MDAHKKRLLIGLGSLIWFFTILVTYYLTHKPLTPALAAEIGLAAWRLAVAVATVSLAGGIGRRLVQIEELHPLANAYLQAALGLGILALGVLLAGALAGLPRWLLWLSLPVLGVWLRRSILAWWRQWAALRPLWQPCRFYCRAIGLLIALLLLCSLLTALAPPLKFDALMYHLTLPKAYLLEERVAYLPWLVMSGMPQISEMLYTWADAFGGSRAATVLGWSLAPLLLAGLLGYLSQRFDVRSAWTGAASLWAGASVATAMAWGYADWSALFFGLGVLIALDCWRQNDRQELLVLGGVFAGLAFGSKYTAGVLALAGGAALVWHAWKERRPAAAPLIRYGLAASLAALPWLLKNLLTTGNPLYPFLFPAGAMSAVRLSVYQGLPAWGNWQDILFLPLRATLLGIEGQEGYGASIGPLLLGLGGLAWVGWKQFTSEQRPAAATAAAVLLAGWLVWAVGNQLSGFLIQIRYYYALFPAAAVLAAAAYWKMSRMSFATVRLGRVLGALVLLALALNVIEVGRKTLQMGALQALFALKTEEEYLAGNLGWFAPAMQEIQNLPEGAQTLLLFEPRSLYCLPHCRPDEILDRWKRSWAVSPDPAAIQSAWKEEGFTHVLFYQAGAEFMQETGDIHYNEEEWRALSKFLETLPLIVNFDNAYLLYRLPP